MTNGVSVSVIAALLVGPVASTKLAACFFPTLRVGVPHGLSQNDYPSRAYQIQIPEEIGKKKHANASGNDNRETSGGAKKFYVFCYEGAPVMLRDLSPLSIQVDIEKVHILDFGIAKPNPAAACEHRLSQIPCAGEGTGRRNVAF